MVLKATSTYHRVSTNLLELQKVHLTPSTILHLIKVDQAMSSTLDNKAHTIIKVNMLQLYSIAIQRVHHLHTELFKDSRL
jgi:flagellin-specific chaperone FliS